MNRKLSSLFLCALLLTTAGVSPSFGATPSPAPTATCSKVQTAKATQVINNQIKAIAKSDFKTAETYSSTHFRSTVSLAKFKSTITANYAYLGNIKSSYSVACLLVSGFVVIAMNLTDITGVQHHLIYGLTPVLPKNQVLPNDTGWGIDGIHVAS